MTIDNCRLLERLAPYGQANPTPIFSTNELAIYDLRLIGSDKHLKLSLTNPQGEQIDAVAFGMGEHFKTLQRAEAKVELAFNLEVNSWQGRDRVQLMVKDIVYN